MMVRRLVVALFFAVFGAVLCQSATAQSAIKVGMTAQIVPISSMSLGNSAGVEKCGQYFTYSGTPSEAGKVGLITLIAESPVADGSKTVTILPWGTDKFQIRINETATTPALKILRVGGPVYPWAEISISSKDLKQAPCLQHSRVVG